jgi:hypothetical protein
MLAGIRRALVEYAAPEVSTVYGRTQLTYAITLVSALAREAEDGVANIVAENATLRRLLLDAGERLDGTSSVSAELVSALKCVEEPAPPADLRLSALRAENGRLFELFIRLQAQCEEAGEADAAAFAVRREAVAFLKRRAEGQAGGLQRR